MPLSPSLNRLQLKTYHDVPNKIKIINFSFFSFFSSLLKIIEGVSFSLFFSLKVFPMSAHHESKAKRARTSDGTKSPVRNVRHRGRQIEAERRLVTAKALENITAILLAQNIAASKDSEFSSSETEQSSSEIEVSDTPIQVIHEALAIIQEFATEAELPPLSLEPNIALPQLEEANDAITAPLSVPEAACEIPTHLESESALPCEEGEGESLPLEHASPLPPLEEEENASSDVFSVSCDDAPASSHEIEYDGRSQDFPYEEPQVLESGMHRACCRCAYCQDDEVQSERRASCYVSDDTSASSSSTNSEDDTEEHQTIMCERNPDTGEFTPVLAPQHSSVRVELCPVSSLMDDLSSEGDEAEDIPEPVLATIDIEPYDVPVDTEEIKSPAATWDDIVCEKMPAHPHEPFPEGEESWQLWNDRTKEWEPVCIDCQIKVAVRDKKCQICLDKTKAPAATHDDIVCEKAQAVDLFPVEDASWQLWNDRTKEWEPVCIDCQIKVAVRDKKCQICLNKVKVPRTECIFCSETPQKDDELCDECVRMNIMRNHVDPEPSSDSDSDSLPNDVIYTVDRRTGAVLEVSDISEISRFPCLLQQTPSVTPQEDGASSAFEVEVESHASGALPQPDRDPQDRFDGCDSDSSGSQGGFFRDNVVCSIDKDTGVMTTTSNIVAIPRFPRQIPSEVAQSCGVAHGSELSFSNPIPQPDWTPQDAVSDREDNATPPRSLSLDFLPEVAPPTMVYTTPKLVGTKTGSQIRLSTLGKKAVNSIPLAAVPSYSRPTNTWALFPAPSLEDDSESFTVENVVTGNAGASKISMTHLINLTDIAVLSASFLLGPLTIERSLDFCKIIGTNTVWALAEYARDRYTERVHTAHSFKLVAHMMKLLINLRIKTTTKGVRHLGTFEFDVGVAAKEIALDWVNRLDELLLNHSALDGYHMYVKIKLVTAVILAKHNVQTFQNEGLDEPIRYSVRR
jgi:hypothetical protein